MSPRKDQDYFCDGMAEELINGLSGIDGLRVAARASTFQLKGEDIRKIGNLLNVRSVLDGSVRTAGTRMRVTAQLNNVSDGYQLWSKRYDRDMDDVFAVQDAIASDIIGALQVELGSRTPARARHTDNVEAYHLYLKGRHHFFRRTPEEMARSKEFFQQALVKDPNYALALAGLADYYSIAGFYGFMPSTQSAGDARETARRALAIDEALSEAYNANAFIQGFYYCSWTEAARSARQSVARNPTNVIALLWGAAILSIVGDCDEAVEWLERARLLDPLSPYVSALAAFTLLLQFRDEEALKHVEPALVSFPKHPVALYFSGAAYVRCGELGKAIEVLERAVDVMDRLPFYLGWSGWAYGVAGRTEEAQAILAELRERSITDYVLNVSIGWVLGALGAHDDAIECFSRAIDEREALMRCAYLPPFDTVRSDPRFPTLLRRMNVPQQP